MEIRAHHHTLKLMGCQFVLTAVSADKQLAWDAIRAGVAEITRIEELISSWREDSFTSLINRNAGYREVKVPRELLELIRRSLKISALTKGAFDICGNLSRFYWKFDGRENPMLSPEKIAELCSLMDYRMIETDPERSTVYLQKEGMKIGFGGIGKGYAALRAKEVMENMGIRAGLINASGDLMAWGNPPGRVGWEINISDPEDRRKSLLAFVIPHGSVVTSGNYENFTLVDGKRLSHIIDPRTGMPVDALKCVSVVCPNPEFADAMATAVSVLGLEDGLELINLLDGVEALIIDNDNKVHCSNHLKSFIL